MKAWWTRNCSLDWGSKQLREIARSRVSGNHDYSDIECSGWQS